MPIENSPRQTGAEAASSRPGTGPSRRRLLKSGLFAGVGALVGGSGSAGAAESSDDADSGPSTVREGAMVPYQFVPNARFAVLETDPGWRPGGVDPSCTVHAIEYEHAPSMRAVLFAGGELPGGRGRTFELGGGSHAPPVEADRRLVGVTVDA